MPQAWPGRSKFGTEYDSSASSFRRRRFGDEMCVPLECHQSAKVRTAVVKRVGARFGLALVPIVQQWELFIQTYVHL